MTDLASRNLPSSNPHRRSSMVPVPSAFTPSSCSACSSPQPPRTGAAWRTRSRTPSPSG
jgi:hypothetical protein